MRYYADIRISSVNVDVSDYLEDFEAQMSFDIEKLHVPTFNGESFKLRAAAALGIEKGQYFRIARNESGVLHFIFTGYIENIKQSLKTGDITIEVLPEIEHFKTQSIDIDPAGTTHYERLYSSLPTGYGIGFLDSVASAKANTNAFLGGLRVTYPYTGRSYADLLHDHMLIMNYVFSTDRFFFYVMNKSIWIGSNQDDVILDADMLVDIETDSTLTEIEFLFYTDINDALRGTGVIAGSLPPSGTFYKRENKITTQEELGFLNNVSYDSVDYGVITGVRVSGILKTYTATVIEFVAA